MENSHLRTAHTAKGEAVFALIDIPRNAEIGEFEGYEVDHDTQHSLTLDGVTIEPTGILRFLSHSCEPNAYFKGRMLFAMRLIKKEEEITIDYMVTEQSFSHPFECRCGSSKSRKKLG